MRAEVCTTISLHAAIEAVHKMALEGHPSEFSFWDVERLEAAAKMMRRELEDLAEPTKG